MSDLYLFWANKKDDVMGAAETIPVGERLWQLPVWVGEVRRPFVRELAFAQREGTTPTSSLRGALFAGGLPAISVENQ